MPAMSVPSKFSNSRGFFPAPYVRSCVPIPEAILPTPDKISKETAVRETGEERVKFLADGGEGGGQGAMPLGSARTLRARPSGGERKGHYSG